MLLKLVLIGRHRQGIMLMTFQHKRRDSTARMYGELHRCQSMSRQSLAGVKFLQWRAIARVFRRDRMYCLDPLYLE
jgi:hypothetical protein